MVRSHHTIEGSSSSCHERDAHCEWGRPRQAVPCLKLLGNGDELPCHPTFLAGLLKRHGARVVVKRDNKSNLHGPQPDLSLHLQTGRIPAKHEKKRAAACQSCAAAHAESVLDTTENVTLASPKLYFSAFLR